jgi:SOS-response transcriptional repressor LexA
MVTLTAKQAALLRYIAGYQAAHGYSPSYREMCDGVGIRSNQRIFEMVDALEERGAISRLPRKARAITINIPVPLPRAPDGAPLRVVNAAEMERGAR